MKLEAFEFVEAPIPRGGAHFKMGSPPDELNRSAGESQVDVTLTKPFQMGTAQFTQGLIEAMGIKNPSNFSSREGAIN